MICSREGCNNPLDSKRSTKKYCSARCRKLAYLALQEHQRRVVAGTPDTTGLEDFIDAPEPPEQPKEIVRRVKGAKAYETLPPKTLKCGHPKVGTRCLQKECFGFVPKGARPNHDV